MAVGYYGPINAEVTISASRNGGTVNFSIPWKVYTDSGWEASWRRLVVDGTRVYDNYGNNNTVTGTLTRSVSTYSAGTKTVSFTVSGTYAAGTGSGTGSVSVNYSAYSCTVTLNAGAGSGGTGSVTATYGNAMAAITPPTRTGYAFGGYYSGEGGTGTKYYNTDGSNAHNADFTGATTLYAFWEPMSILHLVRNGTPETVTDIRVVQNGTPKQVLSVWSVENGTPRQGI